MTNAARPTTVDVEALLTERWFALDEDDARVILRTVADLTDEQLLDRPHLLTGAVIAGDIVRTSHGTGSGDRAALLERYSAVAAAAVATDSGRRDTPAWLVIRMIAARWKGDMDQAIALSQRLARSQTPRGVRATLLDEAQEADRPGQIALQRGMTELLAGRTSAAMVLFSEAHRAGGAPPHRHFASVNGAANAAMLAAIEGHDLVADEWLARVGDLDDIPEWCRDLTSLGASIASLVLATDVLDVEGAEREAERLRRAGDRFELWPFQLSALTQHDLACNRPVQAYRRLKQVGFERDLTIATETVADHIVFRAYLDTLIAGGEGGLALRLAEDVGTPLRALVPIARTHLLAGDAGGAARVAARAMRRVLIPERDMWEATIVHAIARLRQGEKDSALRSFGIVLAGRPRSLPSILARQPAQDVADLYQLAGLEPPTLTRHADPLPSEVVALTTRERRVLQHLVDGLNAGQIAMVDVTSEHTVRTHIKRIYRKLKVSTRDDAVAWANQHGLARWHHRDGHPSTPV